MARKHKGRKKKKSPPPSTREEGSIRMGRYMRYMYDEGTMPDVFVPPLIDATLAEIEAIEDTDARKALLQELMDKAYSLLGDT